MLLQQLHAYNTHNFTAHVSKGSNSNVWQCQRICKLEFDLCGELSTVPRRFGSKLAQ